MQNPFSRLKHYRPSENDSKENHATESLAACLVLSEDFRNTFIAFLFGGDDKVPEPLLRNLGKMDVETQRSTDEGKFLDLLLTTQGYGVVVEVKVEAAEDLRHRAQLDNYEHWLQGEFPGQWSLFTLVKNPDTQFAHQSAKRRLWANLYDEAKRFAAGCTNPTDRALLTNFCEYLLLERVVDNMDYTKLADYGKGWVAETVLKSVFENTCEKLKARIGDDLLAEMTDWKRQVPRFELGRKSWARLFGEEGWNNKVYDWIETSAFDAKCPSDSCKLQWVIWLWCKDHGQDWGRIRKSLPTWLEHLSHKEGLAGSEVNARQPIPWTSDQAQTLDRQRIYCFWQGTLLVLRADDLRDPNRLADIVAERVHLCFELVDGLPLVPCVPEPLSNESKNAK